MLSLLLLLRLPVASALFHSHLYCCCWRCHRVNKWMRENIDARVWINREQGDVWARVHEKKIQSWIKAFAVCAINPILEYIYRGFSSISKQFLISVKQKTFFRHCSMQIRTFAKEKRITYSFEFHINLIWWNLVKIYGSSGCHETFIKSH